MRKKSLLALLPRWALIAASLAVMAGFVLAGVKWKMESGAPEGDAGRAAETGTTGTAGTTGTPSAEAAPAVSAAPDLQSVSAVSASQSRQPEGVAAMNTAGEATAAALAAATAASPRAAANGDGYQYIISGEIVAVTEGCSSDSSATTSLASGTLACCSVCESEFAAGYRTSDECIGALRSDVCKGMMISIR